MFRIITLATLYLSGVGAAAQIAKIIPVFGYLEASKGLSLSDATLTMSAIGFSAILLGAIVGRIIVSLGLWRMLAIASVTSIIAGLILPAMPNFQTLLAVRVVEGIGHLVIVSAAPTLMVNLVEKNKVPLGFEPKLIY